MLAWDRCPVSALTAGILSIDIESPCIALARFANGGDHLFLVPTIGVIAKLNWQLPPKPLFHAGFKSIRDSFQVLFYGPFGNMRPKFSA